MKKLLIGLLLIATSTSAIAEWKYVTPSIDGDMNVYVDLQSILKTNYGYKMWVLYDYKTVKKLVDFKYRSFKTLNEYDCKNQKKRAFNMVWFTGNMGTGKISYFDSSVDDWTYFPPDSFDAINSKIACDIGQ